MCQVLCDMLLIPSDKDVVPALKGITNYSSSPLPTGDTFQDPSGCLKPWMVWNPVYTMFFLYIYNYDKV